MWITHRKEIRKLTFRASLWRKANAGNVSFRISLRWLIHIINPVDKTQLSHYTSHRRSTTVSLETYHSRHFFCFLNSRPYHGRALQKALETFHLQQDNGFDDEVLNLIAWSMIQPQWIYFRILKAHVLSLTQHFIVWCMVSSWLREKSVLMTIISPSSLIQLL